VSYCGSQGSGGCYTLNIGSLLWTSNLSCLGMDSFIHKVESFLIMTMASHMNQEG
jgi:hypothetical protein